MSGFPAQRPGTFYMTEGGQETEIMYRHGHDLPEFAMFPLLDRPRALADIRAMYAQYLEAAVRHGFIPLMGGLDYRASPDWGTKLGYSAASLAEMQLRAIALLRDIAAPFRADLPGLMITGIVGPRGDAYSLNRSITFAEAEDYHAPQMATLKAANVDLVSAMTFNATAEAIGVARAAAHAGLPLAIYFTLDGSGRLKSGHSLREAIAEVDREAGAKRPDFYGINCSHPLEFAPALEPGSWVSRIRALRPNASVMEKQALCQIGHLVDGDPPELGRQMAELARRYPHIDVWGGCCGTWDRHLDAMAGEIRRGLQQASPARA